MIGDASVPGILAIAFRSPSYFVLKKMLMFIADLIAIEKTHGIFGQIL